MGLLALCHGDGLSLHDGGLGRAVLLEGVGFGLGAVGFGDGLLLDHRGLGQPQRGFFGRDPLGHQFLGGRVSLGRVTIGLGRDYFFFGGKLGRVASGLGRLDLLDQPLLGLHLGRGNGHCFGTLGGGDLVRVFDLLLLFDHRPFHDHSFADHLLDGLLLDLDRLVLVDVGQGDEALPLSGFQLLVPLDPFDLHLVGAFLVPQSHDHLAAFVFLGHGDLLFGGNPCPLRLEPLLLGDLLGLGPLAGGDRSDLALLLLFRLGQLAFQFEDRFAGLDVLLLDRLFLLAGDIVGQHGLRGRLVCNLLDALRVEDVLRVELIDGRLLEVVDGRVVEDVAVEVAADDLNDLVLEVVALLIEHLEVELLTDRLERLGELGSKQGLEGVLVGGARATDRLGDAEHVVVGLVDAEEEGDLDVGADVVAADQPLRAVAVNLDGLDRYVHHFGAVEDRQDDTTGEGNLGFGLGLVDDERRALIHLAVEAGDHDEDAHQDDKTTGDECDSELSDHLAIPLPFWLLERRREARSDKPRGRRRSR